MRMLLLGALLLLAPALAKGQESDTSKEFEAARAKYTTSVFIPQNEAAISFDVNVLAYYASGGAGTTMAALEAEGKKRQPTHTFRIHLDAKNIIVEGDVFAYVSTPRRAFVLYRQSKDQPFAFKAATPVADHDRSPVEIDELERKVEGGFQEVFRPTKLKGNLLELVPIPGRRVVGAKLLSNGMQQFDFVKDADQPSQTAGAIPTSSQGHCVVDPGREFIPLEFSRASKGGGYTFQDTFAFAYHDGGQPFATPVVKTYKSHTFSPTLPAPHKLIVAEFSNYKLEPVPAEKMTPEYFGLPDPIRTPAGNRLWWVAAAVGVTALCLSAVWLLRRRRTRG